MKNIDALSVSDSLMVLFHEEIVSCFKTMLDISAKPTPLYLASSLSSTEPDVIFSALLLLELASLTMLFILQLRHTSGCEYLAQKKLHSQVG